MTMEGTRQVDGGQYLSFQLGEDRFAVDVKRVEVVLEYLPITRVPKALPYMRGVINYRGTVVPVVDIKEKLGMGRTEFCSDSSIIVLQVRYESEDIVCAALADSVAEVFDLADDQIDASAYLGGKLASEHVRGIGKKDGEFIFILDFDLLLHTKLSSEDIA